MLPKPKNVIIMIGDGMGYNCLMAADFYFRPSAVDSFPVSLAVATFPSGSGYDPALAWSDTLYIKKGFTESAAAATALATGAKTNLGVLGLSPRADTLMNLTELAKSIGKSAGVITSVPFSHATPAGFVAHNKSRNNYPQIAIDMLFRSRCDLIMGCGNPEFDSTGNPLRNRWAHAKYVGDSVLWLDLKQGSGKQVRFRVKDSERTVQDVNGDGKPDPWTVITREEDFRRLMNDKTPLRLLGCPEVYATLQQGRRFSADETNDSPPFVTPFIRGVPSLAEMVKGGLNVLNNNPAGFFVMIEGGAIDWANHENQKGRMLEEMKSFRDAIDTVMAWVEKNSSWKETLLIVTADHESGDLWGGPPFTPVVPNGPGQLPVMKYNSGDHTNALVAVYAYGIGSSLLRDYIDGKDPVRGPYIQNTAIPTLIFRLWRKSN